MDFDNTKPIYLQIIDLHKKAMINNRLKHGDKILSQRAFAEQHNVNPNTVQRAYREMEAMGLVQTVRGQGTFIYATKEMLCAMKQETANDILSGFIQEMKDLGYTLAQAMSLVQGSWSKEENES